MDALQGYLSVALPDRYTVLGQRLRPYCIGHAMLLHKLGSPFARAESSDVDLPDLMLAVAVCSQPYESFVAILGTDHIAKLLRHWHRRAAKFPLDELQRSAELFGGYLRDHSTFPDFWIKRDGGRQNGSPYLQTLKIFLMARMGMSESQALNTTLALAQWDYCAWLEANDCLEIVNEKDTGLVAAAKRDIAERQKRGQPRTKPTKASAKAAESEACQ